MSYPILSLEELDTNTMLYLILFFVKFKHKQFLNLDVLRASEKVADKKKFLPCTNNYCSIGTDCKNFGIT